MIVAIDPGNVISAYIEWDGVSIHQCEIAPNDSVLAYLRTSQASHLLIEQLACMGQVVGRSILDTAFWSGRFAQVWDEQEKDCTLVLRTDIKKHHGGQNDSQIRAALIAKYGEPGTKKNPGVTYRCKSHLWQAFALATWATESNYI